MAESSRWAGAPRFRRRVPPDYDVEMRPRDVIAGKDPQLEKAIELVLAELDKKPPTEMKRPAYPQRAKP